MDNLLRKIDEEIEQCRQLNRCNSMARREAMEWLKKQILEEEIRQEKEAREEQEKEDKAFHEHVLACVAAKKEISNG